MQERSEAEIIYLFETKLVDLMSTINLNDNCASRIIFGLLNRHQMKLQNVMSTNVVCSTENLSKNEKLRRKYIEFVMDKGIFFREKSHSAKNHQESPMLAKCFLSSKDQGGFNENKLRK